MTNPSTTLAKLTNLAKVFTIRLVESMLFVAFFTGVDFLTPFIQNPWSAIPTVWTEVWGGGNIIYVFILVGVLYITDWDIAVLRRAGIK